MTEAGLDAAWFRHVLGNFPTGVAVVTGCDRAGVPVGLAIGSFASASLDPPLVAFLPSRRSSSWPRIRASGAFCVNILGADQEAVCRVFAAPGVPRFADIGWRPAPSGSPILDAVLAWIDCDVEAVHEAGDHWVVLGRARALDVVRTAQPLIFFRGGYGRFASSSSAPWEIEMESLADDLHVECAAGAVAGEEIGAESAPRMRRTHECGSRKIEGCPTARCSPG